MTQRKTSLTVELPTPEAADLAVQAAKEGISTPELLGYHVLKSAYGYSHPLVLAFEARPKKGHEGTK
ncbi:hypothetical protein GGD40_000892 [Paraburkholderia bryophila]|uniref:Uncharacterized protein n=1 Tax=Paraburkholderia bryophila TaxID=420952 RepID=A0A7Y9WKG4_9BURK|nr:hypothetical protein [Paraburkholderia bryophila]